MSSITHLSDATQTSDLAHDTFRITGTSILDAVWTWVSRTSSASTGQSSPQQKKPKWATTTHGSITTVWTVSSGGTLREHAKICWSRASEKSVLVMRKGQEEIDADQILLKSKGLFGGSNSRVFNADDGSIYKWKSGAFAGVHGSYGRMWHCVANSSSSSVSPRLVATIAPPQAGFLRSEFNLFSSSSSSPSPSRSPSPSPQHQSSSRAASEALNFSLLLTAILMSTHRDDYKTVQSSLTPAELEAKLVASALGTLPPYLPSDANNDRRVVATAEGAGGHAVSGTSASTRRSQSAQASASGSSPRTRSTRRPATASGTSNDPPPYSRMEAPSSHRKRGKEEAGGFTAPRPIRRPATSSAIR